MHKDDQRCRGLGSVYTLNSSTHRPSDWPLSGGSVLFYFHSQFISLLPTS